MAASGVLFRVQLPLDRVPKDVAVCSDPLKKEGHQLWQPSSHHSSVEPARHYQRIRTIPHVLRELLDEVRSGLEANHAPSLASEGSGGVYFMKDECGLRNVAVFKPMDEEPMALNNPRSFCCSNGGEGLKRGIRVGTGAEREVAAYILDHPWFHGSRRRKRKSGLGFAGVPPTMLVRCYHESFHWSVKDQRLYRKPKLGSLQQFVHSFSSCEDMGASRFPIEEVHKITVLDMRLANADRNGGNILVCKGDDESLKLVPIDHGYCLPEKFEDCTFEWLYWPQAQHPYGPSTLEYIASLDAEEDVKLLQKYGINNLRPQSLRVLRVSTMVVKKGASAGLTPFHIGSILSRSSPSFKSPIELMIEEVEGVRLPTSNDTEFLNILAEVVDQYITTSLCQCNVNRYVH